MTLFVLADHWFRRCADVLLVAYQLLLSPDHSVWRAFFPGGACRFHPTCSMYARGAIRSHGFAGVVLAARRVRRCHPGSPGGFDPVPTKL